MAPTVSQRQRGWSTIARYEINELWLGPKGLTVLFLYSLLLGALSYLASVDAGINLLDARESVGLVVQTAIGLGTLSALVVSADAISGERERGTLEALLVTPVGRTDLVIGKLLAATTVWAASLLVALPFVFVMASGPGVVSDAIFVLLIAGSLVAASLTALGLAVSAISMSNRVSLAVSVAVLLLAAAPGQLPAVKASNALGTMLIKTNPVASGLQMASNVLVKQQPWSDQWSYIVAPVVAAIALTLLAIAMAGRIQLVGSK